MARKTNTLVFSPWSGGLNSAQDSILLGLSPESQQLLSIADNILFTTSPSRKKRGGQARFNSTAMTVTGSTVDGIYGTTYWRNNSANTKIEEVVIVTEPSTVFYGAAYGTLTALVASTVTPTFSQGFITSEVMAEKLIIGYSKTATALVYPGGGANLFQASASTAIVGVFPNGNLIRGHQNRLWVAGDSANPDRISYSAAELPFAFGTAGGFIDIYVGDGDPEGITAIFPSVSLGELYVAKRESLFKVVTSDPSPANWSVIRVSRGIGCIQHNSAVAIDQNDIFFASDRGVHSLQQILSTVGIIEGKFLSAPIQDEYNVSPNKKAISAIWAPDLNSFLFSFQRNGKTSFETVYGFNVELNAWYRWTSVPSNFLFRRLNTSTQRYEYYSCGDSTSASDRGFINKLQQTSLWDFSSTTGNIVSTIKTGLLYPGGNFLVERNWLNIILLARSRDESPITVSYLIDELTTGAGVINQRVIGNNLLGSTTLGTGFTLGSPSGAKPLFLHTAGVGNAIQVTIQHDTIGGDLEIFGLGVEYFEGEESENAYRAFPS